VKQNTIFWGDGFGESLSQNFPGMHELVGAYFLFGGVGRIGCSDWLCQLNERVLSRVQA
jgi:hypothetical protein